MGISSKLAKYLANKVKEAPAKVEKGDPRMSKEDVKETSLSVEMTKLSNAELKALAEKAKYRYSSGAKHTRSDAAMDEMDRRGLKKFMRQQGKKYDDESVNPVYDVDTKARLSDAYSASDLRKEIERRNKESKDKGFKTGGMVKAKTAVGGMPKKAPAKKPMPAKKPVAKKPAPKKK